MGMLKNVTARVSIFDTESSRSSKNRFFSQRFWLIPIVLSLALHFFLLTSRSLVHWLSVRPPQIEVQTFDPAKLDALKKKWKAQERLLLSKDRTPIDKTKPEPKDSRYLSDRNRVVEKEQMAVNTAPRPQAASQPKRASSTPPTARKHFASLSSLGVPFDLGQKVPEAQAANEDPQEAREAADQNLVDEKLPQGAENVLNTRESVYYSFYARIYDAIIPVWSSKIRDVTYLRPVQPGDYESLVDVVLDSEGNFLEVRWNSHSGLPEFDQAIEAAWQKVKRFPNPPKALIQPDGKVHIGWKFLVQVGNGFHYAPPQRLSR
jgi:hypothetical protein